MHNCFLLNLIYIYIYILHYYHPDDKHELEFIIKKDKGVIPIEVKSSNDSSVSLNNFIKDFNPPYGIKLVNANIGFIDKKKTIPHFMVMFL